MKVAAIHFGKVSYGRDRLEQTLQENMERLVKLNIAAAEGGADLIVNPELPILPLYSDSAPVTPYSSRSDDIAKHREVMLMFHEKWTNTLTELIRDKVCREVGQAAGRDIYAVLSSFEYSPQHHNFYSSATVIGADEVSRTYRKRQLTSDAFVMRGDSDLHPVDLPFGKVGVMICGDYSMPLISRALVLNGSDLIVIPTSVESKSENTLRARAIENGIPFVLANCYEEEKKKKDEEGQKGGYGEWRPQSAIVDALAETVATHDRCDGDETLTAEFDLSGEEARQRRESKQRHRKSTHYWGAFTDLTGMNTLPEDAPTKRNALVITISGRDFGEDAAPGHMLSLIDTASRAGTPVIVVLPELTVEKNGLENHIRFRKERGYYLACGFAESNRRVIALFGPHGEEPLIRYEKVHLTDDEEDGGMQPGDRLVYYLDLPMGRVGLLSGEDLLYPEAVEAHRNARVDIILAPSRLNCDAEALFEDIAQGLHMIVAVADQGQRGGIYQRYPDAQKVAKVSQSFVNSLVLDTVNGRIEAAKGYPLIPLRGLEAITRG